MPQSETSMVKFNLVLLFRQIFKIEISQNPELHLQTELENDLGTSIPQAA
jgi:hypothetical protein